MYAEKKTIPLTDVRIQLSHHRKASEEQIALERIDVIEGIIHLKGELDAAQRRRLVEIASRCWMHRTLSKGVSIRFRSPEEGQAASLGPKTTDALNRKEA